MLGVLLYSILSVQIVYSVQLNCTYSNYTQAAAATSSAAQQHTNCPADVFWSAVQPAVWNYIVTYIQKIRSFRLTLLAASAVTQFDSNKKQVDVTYVTNKLCKLQANSISFSNADLWENFLNHTEFYSNELTVQLALGIK